MRYRRALFVLGLGRDAAPQLAFLRRVAPELEHLLVVAELETPAFAWLLGERPQAPDEAALEALREAAAGVARSVDVKVTPELGGEALAALCGAERTDLLVFGSRSLRRAWVVSAERKRQQAAVLWCEGATAPGPIREIACVVLDEHSRAELAAFLRDHTDRSHHVTLLSRASLAPDLVATSLQVSGIEARVDVSSLHDAPSMQAWIEEWVRERPVDLLVLSRISSAFLASALRTAPVLLLPPPSVTRPFGQRSIDVPDLLDDGGPIRARADHVAAVGNLAPVPDQQLAFVSGGQVVATVSTQGGELELPPGLSASALGVYRVGESPPAEPLAAIEEQVAVIGPGSRPVVVVDSALPDQTLRSVAELAEASATDVLAVRLRPTRSCRSIRERLRDAGLSPQVLDARVVLDEGEALDVSEALDPIRLARVASRLARAGSSVSAIVHRGEVAPLTEGFGVLSAADLAADSSVILVARPAEAVTPLASAGNRIELELDNARARRWLLEAIALSEKTLHFQVYMAEDDDVGGPVEEALARAAARGVTVRVLVDSLHGLHGSFGARNPLLERLAARPGVELRALRPITELPSLTDLKRRDHRKLVVADGKLALLGGRNLSHEYYTGFDEVLVTPASTWRHVPWLDAGARVEGPAVEALESSFLETWVEAGGAPFAVGPAPAAGSSNARVVVHHGLREARTLETYLELVGAATSHLYVVNGFPLVLELQHALMRALRRGVRVRVLLGCATPTHGGRPFGGPWSNARTAAMELTHSRVDPIIAAGGEVHLFALRDVPGWAPELGLVHPHVHAKVMCADGERCAVGSANMDITASYWESELLLVVEDAALARAFEAELDRLMAGSTRLRSDDPAWQELAERRAWMRHWPGVLSA